MEKKKMIPKIITYNSLIHNSAWKKVGLRVGKEKYEQEAYEKIQILSTEKPII